MTNKVLAAIALSTISLTMLHGCKKTPERTSQVPASTPQASASTPQAPARLASTPIKIKSLDTYPIPTCPPPNAQIPVINIKITDLTLKKLKHDSQLYHSDASGVVSSGNPIEEVKEIVLNSGHDTRIDFDAKPHMLNTDRILVEIEIADNDIQFYNVQGYPDEGANDISASDTYSKDQMCRLGVYNPTSNTKKLAFYVKKPAAGERRLVRYNVALLVDENPKTNYRIAVVLDPDVKNEG
jgi:hypothetical protein